MIHPDKQTIYAEIARVFSRAYNPLEPIPGQSWRSWYLSQKGTLKTVAGETRAALKDCKTVRELFAFMADLPKSMSENQKFITQLYKLMVTFIFKEVKENRVGADFATVIEITLFEERFKERFEKEFPEIISENKEFFMQLDERKLFLISEEMMEPGVALSHLHLLRSQTPIYHRYRGHLDALVKNYNWDHLDE